MLSFSLLALFVASATATFAVFEDGTCPPVRTKENFDFEAYGGLWYEIAKFPNPGEEGDKGKCTTAEYRVNELRGKVRNTHIVDGHRTYIDGDLTLIAPAKIMLTYTFGDQAKNSYLYILDTDYETYSIGYSCRYFKSTRTHQLWAWIMSRTKTLEPSAQAAVEKFFADNPRVINVSNYVQNDHSDQTCKVKSSKQITEFLKPELTDPNYIQ